MATLYDTYKKHVNGLALALANAQQRGVCIDLDTRATMVTEFKGKIAETAKRINGLVAKATRSATVDFNPNSPKQVQKLLYEVLRFPVVYNADGRPTTDEESILKLSHKYPDEEVLRLIIEYRKDTKLVSTFLEVAVDQDGAMHTSYNVSGTKNYRISSSQDLFGSGMNLQNIPTGKRPGVTNIRQLFVSRPGCSFVKADLVQAEAMVVARILCRYKDYSLWNKYAYEPGFDVHRWAASAIFGKPEADISSYERSVGKIRTHSGHYCSGPRVIQSTAIKWDVAGVDFALAKRVIDSLHTAMPGLRKWWAGVERQIQQTRTLTTCLGRRRIFFGRTDDNTVLRDAVAFEPQSTVGDVCNTMFRRLYGSLESIGAYPLLQVHDEVVSECPDDVVDKVIEATARSSAVPLYLNEDLEPLLIPIEVSIGKNWNDMKKA
jgi:DNA polymerase-1